MVQKKKMSGAGRMVPINKNSVTRVNLSPRQVMSLKRGRAITIKAITDDGTHQLTLPEMEVKNS